jgi:hypothetical protein
VTRPKVTRPNVTARHASASRPSRLHHIFLAEQKSARIASAEADALRSSATTRESPFAVTPDAQTLSVLSSPVFRPRLRLSGEGNVREGMAQGLMGDGMMSRPSTYMPAAK